MNFLSELLYFYTRKIEPGLTIPKDALVIDIGSGDKPFWRADVYVDDLSLQDVQRASHSQTIHNIGTFVDANVMHLPFKDHAFDFSFSSHLLEHVIDPQQAIKEIMRVSKAGYFEVPNGILETIKPFHSHLWFIYDDLGTLVFFRKSQKMHNVLTNNGKRFIPFFQNIRDPFIRVTWKKNIKFEIIDPYTEKEKFYAKNIKERNSSKNSSNVYITAAKILRFLFYKEKNIPASIYKTKLAKKNSTSKQHN